MNSDLGSMFGSGDYFLPYIVVLIYFSIFYFLLGIFNKLHTKTLHKIHSLLLGSVRIITLRSREGNKQFRQLCTKSWLESFLADKESQIRLMRAGMRACILVLVLIFLLGLILIIAN